MQGNIDSWAIRFCFHQFQNNLFSVYPSISKIQNSGFTDNFATNTLHKYNRFQSEFDLTNNLIFNFDGEVKIDQGLIRQFIRDNSTIMRLLNKLLNFIH